MSARSEFPPEALRQYALIADGERGALCGPHGELVWLCAPRWHDDAVFSTLLGGAGAYAITPRARCVWGGRYEPRTLIWCNRWVNVDGTILECRDALATPADDNRVVVLRRVVAVDGPADVIAILDVRARFGASPMRDVHRSDDGTWSARSGDYAVRWTGADEAHPDDNDRLELRLRLDPGNAHDLVLEIAHGSLPSSVPKPKRLWRATEKWWQDEVPVFERTVAPRDATHAYAIMRGLTSRDGGMVAAATTSLPESAEKGANYDYRYAWIRDQAYAGIAVAADGAHPLLTTATSTVAARILADGPQLQPAYRVDGAPVPGVEPLDLPGYPGACAVRGNGVGKQFQLDTFGEALLLFARAASHDVLDAEGWQAAEIALAAIENRWDEPDAGIWELDRQWWTHSRLSCIAGLRELAAIAPQTIRSRLSDLADRLLRAATERCVARGGWWQRTPGDDRVDAALLLPPVRRALPADDPRTVATLDEVRRTLMEDGYVYRFAPEHRRLGEDEGAFLLCGFILSLAELQQGNVVAAFRSFERDRASCGPPALLAEEFDVGERQLRGNLPQAFVHAMLFETSAALADHDDHDDSRR